MRQRWWLWLVVVTGCIPEVAAVPDAGARCELNAPLTAEISEGGRQRLELPAGAPVTGWSVTDAGGLLPSSLEGGALQLKAPYGSAGSHVVSLALDCGGTTGSAQVQVTVTALAWSQLSSWSDGPGGPDGGPPNREYGVMWQDSADANRLLVFGGFQYVPRQFTPSWDLWEFNLETLAWRALTMANEPPHFMGGRVAPVPGEREVLFVGGVDENLDAVFHFDRFAYAPGQLTWRAQPSAAHAQFGDYQPGFVFDGKRGRYLSVCGQSATFHCNVRSLTLDAGGAATWADVAVTGPTPQGRNGLFHAYDEQTDRVIIFGGDNNGQPLGDTWALELGESPARWVKLGDDPALKRRNGAYALDVKNHRLLAWGGTPDGSAVADPALIALDLDRGSEVWAAVQALNPPAPRASGMAVYDASKQRFIAGFGNSSAGRFPDLWSLRL